MAPSNRMTASSTGAGGSEARELPLRDPGEGGRHLPEAGGGNCKGFAKNEFGMVFTNAKMEAGNDVAQTAIDAAYGYHNFERFRKRFLLMRWHRKR